EEYTNLFSRINDEYLQERIADIRDVVGRLLAQLALREVPHVADAQEPVILVAPEILPSQALTFLNRKRGCGPDGPAGEAPIEPLANANRAADAAMAHDAGASGVGLYRTEYLFIAHPAVPNEEEQLTVYRQVIEAAPNKRVTIRTLDLGGDKQVPYFGHHREA